MKALVIEDNQQLLEFISVAFQVGWPGSKLISTKLGEHGLELAEKESPDVIILDLGLPDVDGFEVLKQVRLFSVVPILAIAERADEPSIVKGLEWGADEYITEPFGQLELLARIRAVMRRQRSLREELPIVYGLLCLYPSLGQLTYNKERISLTRTESLILHHLMINAGQVVTHTSLAELLWSDDYPGSAHALSVYIGRLRSKVEKRPDHPQLILTKPGIGYFMAERS